jgi:hypothetical protein
VRRSNPFASSVLILDCIRVLVSGVLLEFNSEVKFDIATLWLAVRFWPMELALIVVEDVEEVDEVEVEDDELVEDADVVVDVPLVVDDEEISELDVELPIEFDSIVVEELVVADGSVVVLDDVDEPREDVVEELFVVVAMVVVFKVVVFVVVAIVVELLVEFSGTSNVLGIRFWVWKNMSTATRASATNKNGSNAADLPEFI